MFSITSISVSSASQGKVKLLDCWQNKRTMPFEVEQDSHEQCQNLDLKMREVIVENILDNSKKYYINH